MQYVEDELRNWKDYAVDGHFHSDRPWISYHRQCVAGFCALTGYLDWLVATRFGDRIGSITPEDARGCQLSLDREGQEHQCRDLRITHTHSTVR